MKKNKSILWAILGIIMITTSIMYRKYRRAQIRAEQQKVQIEQAKKYMEYQRKQDSIKKIEEYKASRAKQDSAFNSKFDKVKEAQKRLQETMKKLEEEAKKKELN